jgi:hypothetical protein
MRHDIHQLTDLLKQENFEPTSFIEIGSRDGHDTHYISHYFNINSVNCFIIEAHPQCFKNIISQYPQYRTFNIAASNQTGIIYFNAGIFGLLGSGFDPGVTNVFCAYGAKHYFDIYKAILCHLFLVTELRIRHKFRNSQQVFYITPLANKTHLRMKNFLYLYYTHRPESLLFDCDYQFHIKSIFLNLDISSSLSN